MADPQTEKARKQANTRFFSFNELIETETNYRECLENVSTHFLSSDSKSKFTQTDYSKLFSNIESICQLSKHFIEAIAPFISIPNETDSVDASSNSIPDAALATPSESHPRQPSEPHAAPEMDWGRLGHALLAYFRDAEFTQQYKVYCADFPLVHDRLEGLKTNQVRR
jgi:hypothetical protein